MNIRFYAEFNIQISKRPQILGSQVGHILKLCNIDNVTLSTLVANLGCWCSFKPLTSTCSFEHKTPVTNTGFKSFSKMPYHAIQFEFIYGISYMICLWYDWLSFNYDTVYFKTEHFSLGGTACFQICFSNRSLNWGDCSMTPN